MQGDHFSAGCFVTVCGVTFSIFLGLALYANVGNKSLEKAANSFDPVPLFRSEIMADASSIFAAEP